jgi:hypothetical protein
MNVRGQGRSAADNYVRVGEDGRLWTESSAVVRAAYISKEEKHLWSVRAVGDFDAADTWLFIANESRTKRVFIDRVEGYCDTAGLVQVHMPAYPTIAGTVLTPVRLHTPVAGGAVPDVDARSDETGNTQANIVHETYLAANGVWELDVSGKIVLDYHGCIAVDYAAEGGATTFATIWFWVED